MRLAFLCAAVAALCAAPAPILAADDARPQPKLQAPADELPRPADDRLRAGMLQLRAMVAARVSDPAMDEAAHVALAAEILAQVAAIGEGRDFQGRPGRHLQWLLGDISDGAGLMRDAPRLQAKRLGLLRVAETLNFYGREYDHPGWEPIKP
ncbi:MAG TPA: hypothetical protein P5537_05325 [Thauera sp.]|jgi:hypothetical protein|uniref:hypothetical protein n=1 Tax=Thauera sp. TaxID=1905334 RepID=UPI000FB8D100|nr:hypothetical protein [Thauera sp.]MCP5223608.1 hypothetical protein [Thauera sp.]RTL31032.1 MAG: hypothetical protein EKK55_01395 [Rhodocyclaceae bacterium]HPE04513.1 hypothetical protein [Thauera sp.]HRV77497.1 hypothetical protein [Thauera sp.]